MSAGNRVRGGGYAYGISTFQSTRHESVGAGEHFTLVLAGALVMMTVGLLSNEVVASALGRLLGAAWSEVARLVLHIISGGAV